MIFSFLDSKSWTQKPLNKDYYEDYIWNIIISPLFRLRVKYPLSSLLSRNDKKRKKINSFICFFFSKDATDETDNNVNAADDFILKLCLDEVFVWLYSLFSLCKSVCLAVRPSVCISIFFFCLFLTHLHFYIYFFLDIYTKFIYEN